MEILRGRAISRLSYQIHLAKSLREKGICICLAVLKCFAIQLRDDSVKIKSVCKLVAKFIFPIPSILGNVSSDMKRTEIKFIQIANNFSCDGKDLNFKIIRNFRAGERENKPCGSGKRIRIIQYAGNGWLINYFK